MRLLMSAKVFRHRHKRKYSHAELLPVTACEELAVIVEEKGERTTPTWLRLKGIEAFQAFQAVEDAHAGFSEKSYPPCAYTCLRSTASYTTNYAKATLIFHNKTVEYITNVL
jgi:hypothetical protein